MSREQGFCGPPLAALRNPKIRLTIESERNLDRLSFGLKVFLAGSST